MYDRAVLQFDCDCLVGAFHEESVNGKSALN